MTEFVALSSGLDSVTQRPDAPGDTMRAFPVVASCSRRKLCDNSDCNLFIL